MLLAGCGGSGSSAPPNPVPLNVNDINLIFVVSEDLAFQAQGDINPATANLTNRGLARSLKTASFLRRRILGMKNVTQVFALEPMTHLQTANNHPDLVSAETIEQFALLNQITLSSVRPPQFVPFVGNSYPLNSSYAQGSVPTGVATPASFCENCQGLDFNDGAGNNETLLSRIVTAGVPGFYVFSAPWETTSALLSNIDRTEGYNLDLPTGFRGPDYIYAISITRSGSARLVTYNSGAAPGAAYPVPSPKPIISTQCTQQSSFTIAVTGGSKGAIVPSGINSNETVYMIRHADAHPDGVWDDGNYICAGQWRALDLANALRGKINPDEVYSIDPAQVIVGTAGALGDAYSYVRATLTAEPYAIANGLPYDLAASFELGDPDSSQLAGNFFFFTNATGGPEFSNKTVLLAWEHDHIPPTVNWLISTYFTSGGIAPTAPDWPSADYDTIWTVKLDAAGNLTVNNMLCEGIDSSKLPATCPQF